MADIALTIIGLGQVGASFGLALKRYQQSSGATHRFTITGHDRETNACKEAQKRGAIDTCERNLTEACENADIVLIHAPPADLRDYLETIGPVLKPGCVVVETSPLKQPAIEWAKHYLPESTYLVGLAPVLNPDALHNKAADLEHANADLFDRGNLCIAASADCPSEAVELASDLVGLIGLEPHYLDPAEHDGLVAAVEGLPILLGLALFNTAAGAPSWTDLRRLTNPPFALSTAPLEKDPAVLLDFLTLDRENVLHYLNQAMGQLQALQNLLNQQDDDALGVVLAEASRQHAKWWGQRRSAKWPEQDRLASMPDVRRGLLESFGGFLVRRRRDNDKQD
jgi:prephenate dehydrogenase